MTKSEKNLFSPVDYARTFRRLEKQFENMAQANKPSKRDIIATIAPAGRTLYSAIRSGLLDHLNPPLYLKSETLLPALVDEKKQPKLGNWTPDEYSNYWVFAMQWLPTVPITSVPDNRGLQWKKKKWDKELKKVVEVSYNNEADYIRHLQALSTMYAEACSTIADILESKVGKKKKTGKINEKKGKFQPWEKSGDACFIIENDQIKFHYQDQIKDLKLKKNSHTLNLLVLLNTGSLQPSEMKTKICPDTENKASKIVDYANQLLNKKIVKLGFTNIPSNVEYIERDEFSSYKLCLKMHTMEDFERLQRAEPLEDDRW